MKKLFWTLISFVLLVCALDAALDYLYFAGPGREAVRQQLEKRTGQQVEIGEVSFHFFQGFSLYNVKIGKDFSVQKIKAHLDSRALLRRKVEFHQFRFRGPELNLVRKIDGTWNFPFRGQPTSGPLSIEEITIKRGIIKFEDRSVEPPQTIELTNIQSHISFPPSQETHLQITGDLKKEKIGQIKANIHLSPDRQSFKVTGELKRFDLSQLKPYLHTEFEGIRELSGEADGFFALQKDKTNIFHLKTELSTTPLVFHLTPLQVEGEIHLKGELEYNPSLNKYLYKGHCTIAEGVMNTSFLASPIQNLRGEFLFDQDFLTTNGIEGKLKGKSIRARGTLENYKAPQFQARLFTDLPPHEIEKIAQTFHPDLKKMFALKGKSVTQIDFSTNPETKKVDWSGKMYLKEAQLRLPEKPSFIWDQLEGNIEFSPNKIEIYKLTGILTYGKEQRIEGEAQLELQWKKEPETNFHGPLSFYIKSPSKSLLFKGELKEEQIYIEKFNAYGYESTVEGKGKISLTPVLPNQLRLKAKLNTSLLQKEFPSLKEKLPWLKFWRPQGVAFVSADLIGFKNRPKTWKWNLLISGEQVQIKEIPLDEFSMQVILDNQKLRFESIRGRVEQGWITGESLRNMQVQPALYSMKFKAKHVPLERLPIHGNRNPDQRLIGNLNAGFALNGISLTPNSVEGVAYFKVTEGRLGNVPLLQPIWEVVSTVAPGLERPTLHTAKADFIVEKNQFLPQEMEIVGPGIILKPKGRIGLDQTMDLRVKIQFFKPKKNVFNLANLAKQGVNLFGKLIEVHYTGTLGQPKAERVWLPVLEKIVP